MGALLAANPGRPTVLNEGHMERVDTVAAASANLRSGFDGGVSMRVAQLRKPKEQRLRFVFEDREISFGVAADLSLGEVARTLRELVPKHFGEPVSIDCIQSIRSAAASGS